MLDKLLKKYNISEADLGIEETKEIVITYHGAEEEKILKQVVYKVLGSIERTSEAIYVYRYGKGKNTQKIIRCTPSEAAQIVVYFDLYVAAWKSEKEKMLGAFIQKNNIFGTSSDNDTKSTLNPDELADLLKRMRALDEVDDPTLRLEEG